MMKSGLLETILCTCRWLPPFFILAPFLYSLCFCFPRGDDFDGSTRAMFFLDAPGAIYEVAREWLTWSGRYSYHFLAVFFGQAATDRFLYGCVCAFVFLFFAIGAVLLLQKLRGNVNGTNHSAFFACLSLVGLCASFNPLPIFYLLTDALTTGLQMAAFLLFAACLCGLWKSETGGTPPKGRWWQALLAGLFAIGLYEHSALGVFFSSLLCVILAVTAQKERGGGMLFSIFQSSCVRPFFSLFCWLTAGLAVSFLAPGNFYRKVARHVSTGQQIDQLWMIGSDLANIFTDFCRSPWPATSLCLSVILAALVPAKCVFPARAIISILATCLLFVVSVAILHSVSDSPLGSAQKFSGSLCFYIAFAAASCIYIAIGCWLAKKNISRETFFFATCVILCVAIYSSNFRLTAINAANGQMLRLAEFMKIRENFLANFDRENRSKTDVIFGVRAELLNPGIRSRKVDDARPTAFVATELEPVFPVYVGEALAKSPQEWPNLWAAWFYGVGSVAAKMPDPSLALSLAEKGEAIELAIPPALAPYIRAAWLSCSFKKTDPTFNTQWLILNTRRYLPQTFAVLRPSTLDAGRLLPMWLQKYFCGELIAKKNISQDYETCLGAAKLVYNPDAWRGGTICTLPIVQAGSRAQWVFASLDGKDWHKMQPFLQ